MEFNTTKNLGGIGALLMFVGFLPYISTFTYGVLEIVGGILLLIAAKGLADYYQEGGIFTNALYGVIVSFIGAVAFIGTLIYAVMNLLGSFGGLIGLDNLGALDFAQFTDLDWTEFANSALGDIGGFIGAFILAFVVLFAFIVIAAIFYRKSMGLTSGKSGVGLFGTAGMLLLIGAILTIIVIGLLLVWFSILLVAIAFFQLNPSSSAPLPPPPPT